MSTASFFSFLPCQSSPGTRTKQQALESFKGPSERMSSNSHQGLDERQLLLIGIAITCIVLSTIAIALRLVVRWSSTAILWWDDWVAMLALVWVFQAFIDGWMLTPFDISGCLLAPEHSYNSWYEHQRIGKFLLPRTSLQDSYRDQIRLGKTHSPSQSKRCNNLWCGMASPLVFRQPCAG